MFKSTESKPCKLSLYIYSLDAVAFHLAVTFMGGEHGVKGGGGGVIDLEV